VRVIRRANARQAASRNFGVQEATSEWIAFIDADDLWTPDKLERQMHELKLHPKADLCYTARVHFTEIDGVIRMGSVVPVPQPEGLRKALFRNTVFMPSSVLIRRSTFLASGGFDISFRVVEDWDMWMRLAKAGIAFAACQEPMLLYRVHTNSTSHNTPVWLAETDLVFRRHVLPQLRWPRRWLHYQRFRSEHEASAAVTLRAAGARGHLAMMRRSILRDPFHDPHRYKICLHMLYTAMKRISAKSPSA
jgi:glycosyltransferase involved in cell wall biosynthesis